MALYMHIRSKEELLAGVSDRIAAELEVPTDCGGDWATQLGDVARSMRGVLRHHQPALAIFMMTQADRRGRQHEGRRGRLPYPSPRRL